MSAAFTEASVRKIMEASGLSEVAITVYFQMAKPITVFDKMNYYSSESIANWTKFIIWSGTLAYCHGCN